MALDLRQVYTQEPECNVQLRQNWAAVSSHLHIKPLVLLFWLNRLSRFKKCGVRALHPHMYMRICCVRLQVLRTNTYGVDGEASATYFQTPAFSTETVVATFSPRPASQVLFAFPPIRNPSMFSDSKEYDSSPHQL